MPEEYRDKKVLFPYITVFSYLSSFESLYLPKDYWLIIVLSSAICRLSYCYIYPKIVGWLYYCLQPFVVFHIVIFTRRLLADYFTVFSHLSSFVSLYLPKDCWLIIFTVFNSLFSTPCPLLYHYIYPKIVGWLYYCLQPLVVFRIVIFTRRLLADYITVFNPLSSFVSLYLPEDCWLIILLSSTPCPLSYRYIYLKIVGWLNQPTWIFVFWTLSFTYTWCLLVMNT